MPILAPLLMILLVTFAVFGLVGLVAVALTWHKIALFLNTRRERNLIALEQYHSRLTAVVSELLARANEIDQQSKYLPAETEKEWSLGFQKLGAALVLMGDALDAIKVRLDEKNVKPAREMTLLLCREATLVSKRLLDFEKRLLNAEKVQLEQIRIVQATIKQTERELEIQSLMDVEISITQDVSTTIDGGSVSGSKILLPESSEKSALPKKPKKNQD